ncbi:MAG: hypothetical protein IJR83_07635 [Clostridia bacterium]|nr:hypothetical protein [Clostridia bacterium]
MIIQGITDGAVLQRGKDGTCDIYFQHDGTDDLTVSAGTLQKADSSWRLTGIPTGGPYTLTISSGSDSIAFTDLYVGDLWLLGGQSNMEGAGTVTERDIYWRDHPNPLVRAFFMGDEWHPAVPLLHRLWKSKDAFIADAWKDYYRKSSWKDYIQKDGDEETYPYAEYTGVGPGFAFAQKMHDITGVPQGVIPCGIGGSGLDGWDCASKQENYYTSMIRRLRACGGNARGLYWDQGESECSPDGVRAFDERMCRLAAAVRAENKGDLAIVCNQIAVNELWNEDEQGNICWSAIREKQRLLPSIIKDCDTVSTINANLSDLIHKDSDSQYDIGRSAAVSMAYLCGYGGMPSIRFKGFRLSKNIHVPFRYDLDVCYENVSGELRSNGIPKGFSLQCKDEKSWFFPYKHIQNVEPAKDFVRIHHEMSLDELMEVSVWYGIGNNCSCTVWDSDNRYLPAMGPLKVKDYLL